VNCAAPVLRDTALDVGVEPPAAPEELLERVAPDKVAEADPWTDVVLTTVERLVLGMSPLVVDASTAVGRPPLPPCV
jgi:hypothetical protein